jgi:pyrimidine operon attenuation protein / uracil phosphoribosyltransferase
MKKLILDKVKIDQKILRIAYQIAESVCEESEIHLVGIMPKGPVFAKVLKNNLSLILPNLKIEIHTLEINKSNPLSSEIKVSTDVTVFENKTIFILDDVVNSGKTMFYAIAPFVKIMPKKLKTAILVDREHKDFPIMTDFKGLSLSTTLLEHIQVETEGDEIVGVYLM